MIIFHQSKSCRSVCKDDACKSFIYSTAVCLSCRTRNRNACCPKVSPLCFSRVSGCQIDQFFFCQGIYEIHCLSLIEVGIFLIFYNLCRNVCRMKFQNGHRLLSGKFLCCFCAFCCSGWFLYDFFQILFQWEEVFDLTFRHCGIQFHTSTEFRTGKAVSDPDAVEAFFQDPCCALFIVGSQCIYCHFHGDFFCFARFQFGSLGVSCQTVCFFFQSASRQGCIDLYDFFARHFACVLYRC